MCPPSKPSKDEREIVKGKQIVQEKCGCFIVSQDTNSMQAQSAQAKLKLQGNFGPIHKNKLKKR